MAVPWGSWAVNTFFLLTGYLTVRNYKEGGIRFLLKRLCRLWPAFAASVLITSGCMAIFMPERLRSVVDILLNFTMFPSYLGAQAVDGVYWTLPVELTFYFLIMLFMIGRKEKRFVGCLFIWSAVALVTNLLLKLGVNNAPIKLLQLLLVTERAGCFILGAGICLANRRPAGKKWTVWLLFALAIISGYLSQGWRVCLWNIGWGGLIWMVTSGKITFALGEKNLLHRCLIFLSAISYCLYLLHQFIGFAIISHIEQAGGLSQVWIIVPIAISVALATLLHYFVERPAGEKLLTLTSGWFRDKKTLPSK